jgi:hypothetical protein
MTLTLAQLPNGITSANASQSISVTGWGNMDFLTKTGAGTSVGFAGGADNYNKNSSGGTATGSNSISVTSNDTSGSAHRTVQPTAIAECVVAVLP